VALHAFGTPWCVAAVGNADIPAVWMPMPGFGETVKAPRLQIRNAIPTKKEVRDAYVSAWWHAALSGSIQDLEVRFRETSSIAIEGLKDRYLPTALSLTEELSITTVGTHHQKPILIDYHPGQGILGAEPNTCGYVMGLNSVTDYWDSDKHLYNDPRRETAYGVGASWLAPWHLKPYRDYAMRIEGEALACLNKNFCNAWDKANTTHISFPGHSLLKQRIAIKPPKKGGHRAQIVRTQPEYGDATILKTYTQATSNALNYIYIENQYVQLEHWVNFVKNQREEHVKVFAEGRATALKKNPQAQLPDKPAPLFVFLVMPQAERNEMVPSTYATLAQMGQATTVRGYHAQVQDLSQDKDPGVNALAKAILRDTLAATPSTGSVAADLDRLGIYTLTAMLMTYDKENQADKLRINKRDNNAQTAQAEKEKSQSREKRAADEAPGEFSEHDIKPQRYREIYIHSKLMLIDDVFITLGSANLNKRSMAGDSELNIAVPDHPLTKTARQRVWGNLAGADLDGRDGSPLITKRTYADWVRRMKNNAGDRKNGQTAVGPEHESFIHTYDDPRGAPTVRLA
jgi:phosphatidylserine/phosphatidylglycerophosphate/cardiolipin synthase-like enzyme